MQRDMDLVRKILLELEKRPYDGGFIQGLTVDGYSPEQISYHVKIMGEGRLIEVYTPPGLGSGVLVPYISNLGGP